MQFLIHIKFLCLCTRKINREKQMQTENRSEVGEMKWRRRPYFMKLAENK